MKIKHILLITTILLLSSCGSNMGHIGTANITNVNLSENNFINKGTVTGEARSTWILGIGPISNSALVGKAKLNLVEKANLTGSQVLSNITVDFKIDTALGIITNKTCYMTAEIIEFK